MQKMTLEKLSTQDSQSLDIKAENVAKLKVLFPEILSEKGIDFSVLKQLLGEELEEAEERYSFTWNGKARARRLAQTPSTGTLRPCKEESKDWDTTQNIFIEGDNLEVLKLLQKSYHQKVKMIYIDPPYNTGKDFIYPDDFRDNIKNYLELTGQTDESGKKLSANAETSGRFHTSWLNMMYPRLKLARNLLRDDGIVVISIDDDEVSNLRKVCDEIFGEENFAACLVWDRNRKNDAKYFSVGHEYMLVYFKNESLLSENQVIFRGQKEGVEEVKAVFDRLTSECNSDWTQVKLGLLEFYSTILDDDLRAPMKRFTKVDEKGPFRDDGNINWPGGDGPRYEVLHPHTGLPCKLPTSGWRYPSQIRFWEEVERGRIVFGLDETTVPRVRMNLFENSSQVMVSVHYSYAQTSANQFNSLFGGQRVFDNPKPIDDLKRLVGYLTSPEDVVIDFFAGSGTTGHAVMAQNAADGGSRRHILVQLPEPLSPDNKEQKTSADFCDQIGKPRSIVEITKERIRRAGEKLLADNIDRPGIENLDVGFKVLKLDSSNIKPWDADFDTLSDDLLSADEVIKPERSADDVLFEILLKYGLDLSLPIATHTLAGKSVFEVGAGALLVCLDREITEAVAEAIGKLKTELAPAVCRVVFRDAGFADDAAKVNAVQVLKQFGIDDVKSL